MSNGAQAQEGGGLLARLPSNPYAKFHERGSREEKMREIWGMANDQFWRARAKCLQAGMPNPDNLLPLGKRGRKSDKAEKIKEEWLVEEVKRQSLLE